MTADELAARLIAWATEFNVVADAPSAVPSPKMALFLAHRIAECGEITAPDVITVPIGGNPRRLRVVGIRDGGYLNCIYAEGVGQHFLKMQDIPTSERPKLTQILNDLESRGKL